MHLEVLQLTVFPEKTGKSNVRCALANYSMKVEGDIKEAKGALS